MNPVEVMYAAMPTLLVINPKYIFYLLKPILDFSLLRAKTGYAPPDLGIDYPNALGNDTDTSLTGIDSMSFSHILQCYPLIWASLHRFSEHAAAGNHRNQLHGRLGGFEALCEGILITHSWNPVLTKVQGNVLDGWGNQVASVAWDFDRVKL